MEVAKIDWKKVDSRFVEDALYENINAPKWIDFNAPEDYVDDEAWFCRSDCKHPKTAEDFQKSTPNSKVKKKSLQAAGVSELLPFGENCRRRGPPTVSLQSPKSIKSQSSKSPTSKKLKKFREDSENENPNCYVSSISAVQQKLEKPLPIQKNTENEKNKDSHTNLEATSEKTPKLKNSHSTRNLFAGKEILNQISEFCKELKKLALIASEREHSVQKDVKKTNIKIITEETGKMPFSEVKNNSVSKTKEKKHVNSKMFSPETWKTRTNHGMENKPSVRSCPPSPQRIPSPHSKQKPAASPLKPHLKKMVAAEATILTTTLEVKATLKESQCNEEEETGVRELEAETSPTDILWFLKPCTYLH